MSDNNVVALFIAVAFAIALAALAVAYHAYNVTPVKMAEKGYCWQQNVGSREGRYVPCVAEGQGK